MKGIRKLLVFWTVVGLVTAGFIISICVDTVVDTMMFGAFSAAVVGAGGWFFKANVAVHKAELAAQPPASKE